MDPLTITFLSYLTFEKVLEIGIETAIGESFSSIGNRVWDTIKQKFSNSAITENLEVKRAIRASYLKATLIAIEHYIKNTQSDSFFSNKKNNIKDAKNYIKDELSALKRNKVRVPISALDESYLDLISFEKHEPKEITKNHIKNLQKFLFKELNRNKIYPDSEFERYLLEGWKFEGKEIKWLELICFWFIQEVKNKQSISQFLQFEYLGKLLESIQSSDIKLGSLEVFFTKIESRYSTLKPQLDLITDSIQEIQQTTNETNEVLKDIQKAVLPKLKTPRFLTQNPFLPDYFIGREDDIKNISNHFLN